MQSFAQNLGHINCVTIISVEVTFTFQNMKAHSQANLRTFIGYYAVCIIYINSDDSYTHVRTSASTRRLHSCTDNLKASYGNKYGYIQFIISTYVQIVPSAESEDPGSERFP